MTLLQLLLCTIWSLRAFFVSRLELVAENLVYRQQLACYEQEKRRPQIGRLDRILWACLSACWSNWSHALIFVRPATVIGWHRQGFKLFWAIKSGSGRKRGRPQLSAELRALIRKMSSENPLWGSPRIVSELALLGYVVSEDTVRKYMVRRTTPPSQTWRTFFANHDVAACDFFTVPTATFRLLTVMVILTHDRRRIAGIGVTANPTASWAAQQVVNAFPFDEATKYLLHDNDGIYGRAFQERIASLGVEEVVTAPQSPWQNPFCERVIGTLRRECLDHVIVLNEAHLRSILLRYVDYYHTSRAHLSLDRNAPDPREVEPPELGPVESIPMVGGLHHRYTRRRAA